MKSPGVIKILSDLVAMDSQSYKGNKKIIAMLKEWFKEYECTTQDWVRGEDDVSGQNLIVKIPGDSSDQPLVIICHTDTVPVSDAWETNPFILEEQEGNLYGRGTSDTKGGIAAVIDAVFTLEKKPQYDTYLVFDGDEESLWTGIEKYKKHLSLKDPKIICVEPTDRQLCISAKSILAFEVTTFGKARHASYATPELNDKTNAIYKMQKIMDLLIQDATRLSREKDKVMGTNTQNLGKITGGTAQNVIPEFCTLSVDRRILPSRDVKAELKRLISLMKTVDKNIELKNIFPQQGYSVEASSKFVQYVLKLLQQAYASAKTACFQAMTEGSVLQNVGEVLVLGPGSISQAHVANEYVNTKDLFNFVKIFRDIIEGNTVRSSLRGTK